MMGICTDELIHNRPSIHISVSLGRIEKVIIPGAVVGTAAGTGEGSPEPIWGIAIQALSANAVTGPVGGGD